ncbi:MAG: hypothetical protein IJG15_02550 [Lachnospiraceae bacterium]|nr:hypothetical protein [Lachnospiraceae bacterium]
MTVQYLIDSENVGDFWIPLLELPAEETELIVFYTRNSPHMSYDSLIRLKESNRMVTFIKCYEGTNALDFQLVSELGYRICENEDGRFVIVTNDTGFDAAVKYWRRRKKSVKRITGKEAKNLERRIREDLSAGHSQERRNAAAVPERRYTAVEHDADHDAHVDAWHAERAQDPDGRPSRSNLRDVESAARKDQEELQSVTSTYEVETDYEADDYEPEDEALNEISAPEAFMDDEDADESAVIEETEDDAADGDFTEADFESSEFFEESGHEAGTDAEIEPAVRAEFVPAVHAEQQAARQDQIVQAYADVWSAEDNAVAEDLPAIDLPAAEDTADDEDFFVNAESEQLVLFAPDESGEAPEAEDGIVSEAAEVDAQAETDAAEEDAEADTAITDHQENPEKAGEDAAPEAQHRSKSRRSRSRRSRSSSRKQNAETDAPAGEGNGKAGEEGTKTDKQSAAKAAENEEDKAQAEAGQPAYIELTPVDPSAAPSDEEIARIAACIGADNLAELHNQLATFYGDQGKEIYLSIRNNTRSLPNLKPDLKQKFSYYCEIIFSRSDSAGEYPSDISEFLLNVREKLNNLNSLRYALQKHYGKEKGRRFYFLLKPFAKTMYQM